MGRFYEAEAPRSMQDLRSYSTSYANHTSTNHDQVPAGKEIIKMKKSKSTFGSASTKSWSLSDPELQRKKRVAGYKVYTVEGKMKGSLRKSFKWMKNTYNQMINGWR